MWIDADRLVAEALRDADRGKMLSIPTKRWKFAVFLAAKGPHFLIRAVSRMLTSSRD